MPKAEPRRQRRSPAHSVTFTPALKAEIERFAEARNLPFGAAVRALVTEQLREVRELDRLRRARRWQIAQGWVEAQAIARGDVEEVDWDEIEQVHREVLARARRRESRGLAR